MTIFILLKGKACYTTNQFHFFNNSLFRRTSFLKVGLELSIFLLQPLNTEIIGMAHHALLKIKGFVLIPHLSLDQPHQKYSVVLCGWQLPFWAVQIQRIAFVILILVFHDFYFPHGAFSVVNVCFLLRSYLSLVLFFFFFFFFFIIEIEIVYKGRSMFFLFKKKRLQVG